MTVDTGRITRALVSFIFLLAPLVVLMMAVFPINHILISEELSLSNPLYVLKHYGVMAYPAHLNFDAMVVHPPLLYYFNGLFYILLDNVMYSIGASHVLIAFITFGVVYRLPITANWKLAYVCGFLLMMTHPEMRISVRPLLPIAMIWTAGLLSMEASRQQHWNLRHAMIGSFLIGISAVSHYSAAFSVFGLTTYAGLAFFKAPLSRRWKATASILLPAAVIVIWYLLLNVIPNFWDVVHGIRHAPHGNGILDNIRNHYRIFGIPAGILAAFALIVHPNLRWIGIAVLPVWLFTLLNVFQKYDYWYTEVWLLYFALFVTVMERLPKWLWAPFSILVPLFVYGHLQFERPLPKPAYEKLVRACMKETNGPNARVGSRLNLWYIGGGSDWLNIQPDLYWTDTVTDADLDAYAQNFDVLIDHQHMSSNTDNFKGKTLGNWYADSLLYLKGFFISNSNQLSTDLNMLSFSVDEKPITGFVLNNSRLYKLRADELGEHLFFSLISTLERCDLAQKVFSAAPIGKHSIGFAPTTAMQIGKEHVDDVLFYGIIPRDSTQTLFELSQPSLIIDTIAMAMEKQDPDSLIASQIQNERPIRFFRNYQDWIEKRPLYGYGKIDKD